ncbi:hypothetical protein BH23ACT2_BH23ACT2_30860 [soil metagenome]
MDQGELACDAVDTGDGRGKLARGLVERIAKRFASSAGGDPELRSFAAAMFSRSKAEGSRRFVGEIGRSTPDTPKPAA